MEVKPVLLGVLGGVLYAVTGFLKSREKFSISKFARTITIGAFIGLFNTLAGIPLEEAVITTLTSSGEVAVSENMIKTILRILKTDRA